MAVSLNLDAKCGKYLTFRDLVECGENWADRAQTASPNENWPTRAKTVAAVPRHYSIQRRYYKLFLGIGAEAIVR
jgi:hypothetical protein